MARSRTGRSTDSGGTGDSVPASTAAADRPSMDEGPVDAKSDTASVAAVGKQQGNSTSKRKAVALRAKTDTPDVAKPKETPAPDPGVRLESLGKGTSMADVDEKTSQVVIRRSGRVVERFDDDKAVPEFGHAKKLSEVDRETLAKLSKDRLAEPAARAELKLTLGPDAKTRELEFINGIELDPEKARIRSAIERNDAETYAWVEKQRKARQQRATPDFPTPGTSAVPAALAAHARQEARGDDTIEKEATFSAPNARRAIPVEIGSRYQQIGDKFYHPNNTKVVAFVDRGDKLETPSSASKTAEALVRIAEARGWEDLRVRGTEGFRRKVWLEASVRGIHVDGYKPSELDKAELERRDTFLRDQNSVEVRSEAFQKLSPQEGTRRDPSLANAYAVIQAARAFAKERIPDPTQQTAFVESTRAKIVADLEAGRIIPTVNIRVARTAERNRQQSREAEQRQERER